MPTTIQGSVWEKKDPSSAFCDTKLGVMPLVTALDRKLLNVAAEIGDFEAGAKFKKWFKRIHHFINGLVFSAGEVVQEENDLVSMHIFTSNWTIDEVAQSVRNGNLPGFRITISDELGYAEECIGECGSAWRAFLSGELIISGTDSLNARNIREFTQKIQSFFDNGLVLDDLGLLLARDVSRKIKGHSERVSDKELTDMAMQAMRKRRVEKVIMKPLLNKVRRSLSG